MKTTADETDTCMVAYRSGGIQIGMKEANDVVEQKGSESRPVYAVLVAVSVLHGCNDLMQIVLPALMPVLQKTHALTYTEMGWISFALHATSALLQPLLGYGSDRHPTRWLMVWAMVASVIGMSLLAVAGVWWQLLVCAVLIGLGSALFHPEASKFVYTAAGSRRGFAQSLYQVGGNVGTALAPMLTVGLFLPFGQSMVWGMILLGIIAIAVAGRLSVRFGATVVRKARAMRGKPVHADQMYAPRIVVWGLVLLAVLMIVRSTYFIATTHYYQYYYVQQYAVGIDQAQIPLFLYGLAGVMGTFFGGSFADRLGAKRMIFWSFAGVAPVAVFVPFLPQWCVVPALLWIGFVLMTGFSIVVVFAQQLLPRYIATASGVIIGFAFGMSALASVFLGVWIDRAGLTIVMTVCGALPLIGVLALALPNVRNHNARQ